ncbi:uncharacterized protein N7483_002747 [Penicillium malachiteum]|uniref:uncharacterized protein n=1 Tax=Penicillium malachiteum TaxID=1324776 RepID=UPI002548631C|nr:uncharacterized protein N7483_002747 [Penicillium malachiteum]KAJ5737622.1 hypothetical protein N7483_002747 [Penicillium malachiteum]
MSDQSPNSAQKQEALEDSAVASNSPHDQVDTATEQEQQEEEQDATEQKEKDTSSPTHNSDKNPAEDTSAPPLPDEIPPPLPDEAPPGQAEDDGWEPVWEASSQAYYFYNRFTGVSQWDNPRISESTAPEPETAPEPPRKKSPVLGGYNPAVHGDYDPTASYAQQYEEQEETSTAAVDPTAAYAAAGSFNRFTGRWQADSINADRHNDENKSGRQMNAYFDVDAAANSHDGRSLRAERSAKKLSKKELKVFKEKRREKKEEKRRAWLRD